MPVGHFWSTSSLLVEIESHVLCKDNNMTEHRNETAVCNLTDAKGKRWVHDAAATFKKAILMRQLTIPLSTGIN